MLLIAVTGPESTGKSTLAAALAERYGTVWVPEYARSYIAELDRPYTLADIENIARGQLQAEQEAIHNANQILFCDTDLFVIKVWAEHAFGTCPPWILDKINERHYHLHLLLDVDLPWQPDPQREHPHLRQHFLQVYRHELEKAQVPYALISGSEEIRLQRAVDVIINKFPELG